MCVMVITWKGSGSEHTPRPADSKNGARRARSARGRPGWRKEPAAQARLALGTTAPGEAGSGSTAGERRASSGERMQAICSISPPCLHWNSTVYRLCKRQCLSTCQTTGSKSSTSATAASGRRPVVRTSRALANIARGHGLRDRAFATIRSWPPTAPARARLAVHDDINLSAASMTWSGKLRV